MWTVIKFDKKKITLLKKELREKIDSKFKIYTPRVGVLNRKNDTGNYFLIKQRCIYK